MTYAMVSENLDQRVEIAVRQMTAQKRTIINSCVKVFLFDLSLTDIIENAQIYQY